MAGFKVEKQTAGAIVIDDLGITLTGGIGTIVDLTDLPPQDIARSADLLAAIPASILVVDPRDDTNATILSSAESTAAVQRSNDTHFGISGGRFAALDDPTVTPGANFIIQYNSGGDTAEFIDPDEFISNQGSAVAGVIGGMGSNGTDSTFVYDATATPLIGSQDETNYDNATNNGTFVGGDGAGGTAYAPADTITLSDGSVITVDAVDGNGDVTQFTVTTPSGSNVTAGVALTQSSTSGTGTSFTLTPEQNNIAQGTIQWDVNDSFLRNTGDTLDSGTLTIASGATVAFGTGSSLTIAADITEASIQTPSGGFINNDDLINKEYVDSIAGGFDYKESVRVATITTDVIGGMVAAQDETSYDGAGSNGTFVGGDGVGGTAYVALDTITLSDGTVITVDAVDGNGDVTQFTVTTAGTNNTSGTVLTQSSTSGTGVGFTLTPGTNNISGVYATSPSNGQFTGVDLSSGTGISIDGLNFTGTSSTGLIIGDRVLIKNQPDATQNGIYIIDTGSISTSVTLTRAADMDGSPANEVSGGNTTYVEDTTAINGSTVNSSSRWSVIGDGILTLNTDDIDWTQTGSGTLTTAGIGLSSSGATIDLDVNDLTTATVVATDVIAFHDADGGAQPSGSQTRKSTFQSVFNELDVPNGISTNGIVTRTAEDTYASRSIAVNGAGPLDGLAVSNGDGVSGDPTIGLDIQNLPLRAAIDGGNDRVAVWDSSLNANVYYTVNDIAGAASASNSFETIAGDSGTAVADSPTDTLSLIGATSGGITTVASDDPEIVTFAITGADLATGVATLTTGDFIIVNDSLDGATTVSQKYTFADVIADLGLQTAAYTTIGGDSGTTTATGSDTLNLVGETSGGITTTASEPGTDQVAFGITPIDLATGAATLATGDFIIVSDSLDGATTLAQKYTFQDVIDDLNLTVNGVTDAFGLIVGGDGGVTATAIGTDTITVNGTGINVTTTNGGAGLDTLDLVLDISDLAAGAGTIVVGDGVAVNDGGTTVQYLWSDVIADLSLQTAAYTTINGDSGSTTATGSDTLALVGGTNGGITTTASEPGTDQVTFDITPIDLATGIATLALGDFIIVSDSVDTASTVAQKYTFTDVVQDLDIPNAITANGFVVRTAEDTYASRTITASANEDELGIAITNGDGVAGNPTVGLDIDGLTDGAAIMAAGDDFAVHDASEGTGGANRKMTGQNVADGTADILGITGLTFATFAAVTSPGEDQTLLSYIDSTRASKVLSVESATYTWADNKVNDLDWVKIGSAGDADSGYIMPFNGTIVGASGHCENMDGNTYDFDVYINAVDNGAVVTLTGAGEDSDSDPTLNLDFSAGDKLRIRADETAGGGDLGDVVVTLYVKWRSA